jgi:hypothetical protein
MLKARSNTGGKLLMADSHFSHRSNRFVWLAGGLVLFVLALKVGDIFAGTMPGNDDMMRLQQVRDLLNGQGWFNVDQSRFLTPEGGDMHWSRLPDMFLASVIFVATPLIGAANAEALASVMWPLMALGVTLMALTVSLRRMGVGVTGQVAAILLMGFGGSAAIYNFWPGRIDHHNLVVAFVMTGLAAVLSPTFSARSGIVAAFCIVGTLTVAVEGLPYVGGLILALGVMWIIRGHREASRMTAFGLALAAFSALFYVLDAPGFGGQRMVCDAYGASHFAGLFGGGLLLAAIGSFGGNLMNWTTRLVVGGVAGIIVVALIIGVQPDCLGDPYATVSDQARLAWLEGVQEAKGIQLVWAQSHDEVIWKYGFMLAGLIAAVAMVWTAPAGLRVSRGVFVFLIVLASAATVWQVRGVTFSHLFAVMAAGWAIGALAMHWWQARGIGPVLALAAGALVLTPTVWQVFAKRAFPPPPAQMVETGLPAGVACRLPEAYADIAKRKPTQIFSSIDLGTSILMRTPHSIFAAPYHRNVQGIERATDVYMGSPETARDKMLSMGAQYFLYCRGLNETSRYARLRPDGFAALLETGAMPDWLEPVGGSTETDRTVRLYRIIPD